MITIGWINLIFLTKMIRDYLRLGLISDILSLPFNAWPFGNFITHSNFGIKSSWQNFPSSSKYNFSHKLLFFWKTLSNFKQIENKEIG